MKKLIITSKPNTLETFDLISLLGSELSKKSRLNEHYHIVINWKEDQVELWKEEK